MKKNLLFLILLVGLASQVCSAQQTFYDVVPGNGFGLRLWGADEYKIHMGVGTEYSYGPVSGYSIKSNMQSNTGWGWTWGTTNTVPIAALSSQGNMQIAGSFIAGGHILVGTTGNTTVPLMVAGAFTADQPVVNISNLTDQDFIVNLSGAGAAVKRTIIGPSVPNRFSLGVGAETNEHLTIIPNGNIGVGTTSPDQKLTVNGTIHAKEVKIDLFVPGPDYVFADSYELSSLEKVESYIEQNKHLPEVPSAAEMEKNGINVSEMNMILLKKVEELTLYLLEQNKKSIGQAQRIRKLEDIILKK